MRVDKSRLEEAKISVILRSARSALGASQSDLATELDVSQSAVARLERGVGTIPANVLLRAIRYFSDYGIDISGILESDPQIKFSERFFQEFANRGISQQRKLSNSDAESPTSEKPTALHK